MEISEFTWDDAIEKIKQVKQERDELLKQAKAIAEDYKNVDYGAIVRLVEIVEELEGDSND